MIVSSNQGWKADTWKDPASMRATLLNICLGSCLGVFLQPEHMILSINRFYGHCLCVLLTWSVCVWHLMMFQWAECHCELLTNRQQCLYVLDLQPVHPLRRQTHWRLIWPIFTSVLWLTLYHCWLLREVFIFFSNQETQSSKMHNAPKFAICKRF